MLLEAAQTVLDPPLPGGYVIAEHGCWTLLKGSIVANFTAQVEIRFESQNTTVEIWVDNVSLQPFTKEEWRSHPDNSIDKDSLRIINFVKMVLQHSLAQQLKPGTIIFMNEFNTIEYSHEEKASPVNYKKKLEEILPYRGNANLRAGIDLQGHFSSGQPNVAYMRSGDVVDKLLKEWKSATREISTDDQGFIYRCFLVTNALATLSFKVTKDEPQAIVHVQIDT
ncbi:hypothetical protein M0R45_007619 [Rubus argutus]|uniref:Uncharacterized protein n=1 Tax=Rubus argutus TaxID=59490 RepID=A0AAW1XZK5_RUBAR